MPGFTRNTYQEWVTAVMGGKLVRQHACPDTIPGPEKGNRWEDRAIRTITEHLPSDCSLKKCQDGDTHHWNIILGTGSRGVHIRLRIDIDENGAQLSSYHLGGTARKNWSEEKQGQYISFINDLPECWIKKKKGLGSRNLLPPRVIRLSGMDSPSFKEKVIMFKAFCK
tara:strand:+ start:51 stop:554 length:504 start_codon:yes stop_codon:yes gene_type:complete